MPSLYSMAPSWAATQSPDPNVKPASGTQDVNTGNDPDKPDIENYIAKGQGVGGLKGDSVPKISAGSFTSDDTSSTAAGAVGKK